MHNGVRSLDPTALPLLLPRGAGEQRHGWGPGAAGAGTALGTSPSVLVPQVVVSRCARAVAAPSWHTDTMARFHARELRCFRGSGEMLKSFLALPWCSWLFSEVVEGVGGTWGSPSTSDAGGWAAGHCGQGDGVCWLREAKPNSPCRAGRMPAVLSLCLILQAAFALCFDKRHFNPPAASWGYLGGVCCQPFAGWRNHSQL